MDTKTLIVELSKALAWPVTTIILGLIFRSRVNSLIEGIRLRRLKTGSLEAEFEMLQDEVRAELPAQAKEPDIAEPLSKETEHLIETAPGYAILQTWNQIEARVRAAARDAGITDRFLPEILRALVNKGLIQSALRDSILGLRNMRNLAAHAPKEELAPKQALGFITMAEAAMWSLEQNLKSSKVESPARGVRG